MLSPNDGSRIVLLPEDKQLIELAGWTEKEYREFVRFSRGKSRIQPGTPVASLAPAAVASGGNPFVFVGLLVLGAALSLTASYLTRSRQKTINGRRAELRGNTVQGQNIVGGQRYAPKAGFDSVQNVVEMGSIVPLVYTHREEIDGITYGGIRVNTNLLWSQVLSLGGDQLFRGIFLVGEGDDRPNSMELDSEQFALGNNLLGSYDLAQNDTSRITLYYSNDGGRIYTSDYIAGRNPDFDPGNSNPTGGDPFLGGDVFQIKDIDGNNASQFCYAYKPSTQTSFGLFGWIANAVCFRVSPSLRPAARPELKAKGNGNMRLLCAGDASELAQREKQEVRFSGMSGITALTGGTVDGSVTEMPVGSTVSYALASNEPYTNDFIVDLAGPNIVGTTEAKLSAEDVNNSVASRQTGFDQEIVVGELYKIGSALAVCTDRSPDPFVSKSEGGSAGRRIISLGTFTPGSGYLPNGVEVEKDLIGGSGTGATALISTSAIGQVSAVTLADAGQGYRGTDILTIETIAGSGFAVEVAAVANSGGAGVTAEFEIIREGIISNVVNHSVQNSESNDYNCSNTAQIFRVARGSFVTEYPCRIMEMGMRSSIGIRISGLTNTIEGGYSYDNIDGMACPDEVGLDDIPEATTLVTQNMVAGTVSTPEKRYSFFRISYRLAGTDNDYVSFANTYGVSSETQQAVYNFLRIEMPSEDRWEFIIEPVSSWELRSGLYTGSWIVLDPKIAGEQVSIEGGGVQVIYSGESVPTSGSKYSINFLNPIETALEYDSGSMADPYARLAEAFNYNEVTTSVGGNPEHEIVYINLVRPNNPEPDYNNLAIIGMNIRASREFASLSQFSVYVNRGLGGFHDFPSVLEDLLTNDRFGVGEIVSPEQIDTAAFAAARTWTVDRNYYFDGTITEPLNLREWGTDRARDFLLDFIIRNGRFSLQPLLNFTAPEEITGMFTSGNILEDTFELIYFDQDQRQSPRISVRWRSEQLTGALNNRGLFPSVREITVREKGVSENAPLEQIDMSDFCTSQTHAIDRAKFECRFRRLSTHQIKFTTTADQASLSLGKCFRLGMETLTYDQPRNGYIAEDGAVTSWPELADGSYVVVYWDGTTYSETSIKIANGRSDKARGSVFCVSDNLFQTQTYKVQSLSFNEEGNIDVEAIHWPTDAQGNSDLVSDWDNSSNWVIEGQI